MTAMNQHKAWIFDVDGVVTNPQQKQITEPDLLQIFIKLLKQGDFLALNTGRSLEWLRNRVLSPLEQELQNQKLSRDLLTNFLVVGEKGAAWIENEKDYKDESLSLPLSLQHQVQQLVEKDFADTMFYDTTKHTMISIEMIDGYDLALFHKYQKELVERLQNLLTKEQREIIKIDPTTIATDIENKLVGKAFGMQRILSVLTEKHIAPAHFYLFGDSASDIPMGEELLRQQIPFTFIYVGNTDKLPHHLPFSITKTSGHFEKGTLEFLEQFS